MPVAARTVRAAKRRIAYMEEVNHFFRERGTLVGCPTLSAPLALRMTAAMKAGHAGYDVPFPSWMIEQERAKLGE